MEKKSMNKGTHRQEVHNRTDRKICDKNIIYTFTRILNFKIYI